MPDTTSLIAVGREPKRKRFYECGTWFIIKPSLSSREFSIFAEERRASDHNIYVMSFITNHYMLVQFRGIPPKDEQMRVSNPYSQKNKQRKSIIFGPNGEIKVQSQQIQKCLD